MVKIGTVLNNIKDWWKFHAVWHFKPYQEWKLVKKYFPKPKIKLLTGHIWFFGMPIRKDFGNPICYIQWSNLGWKWKFEFVRHEWDPYIQIVFFRRWRLMLVWHYGDKINDTQDMCTWEAILETAYKKRNAKEAIQSNCWGDVNNKRDTVVPINNLGIK